jgi:hypothetical protein
MWMLRLFADVNARAAPLCLGGANRRKFLLGPRNRLVGICYLKPFSNDARVRQWI